jgi:hypothetical protein
MKALSIRQPWAWLILNAGKDIENRDWPTSFRGRVLIHTGKTMTQDEYGGAAATLATIKPTIVLPPFAALERGGVIGEVEIVDCVQQSDSPWFFGPFGFVLRNARLLPFTLYQGRLGIFDVAYTPEEIARATRGPS